MNRLLLLRSLQQRRDLLDERTYSILCRRLQLELNITDEVLEASQESKGIFLRLDEEKRKINMH